MKPFYIGCVVKYKNPQPSEQDLRFNVTEIHDADGNLKEKLHVRLICNDSIKPMFCHFSDEYEISEECQPEQTDGNISPIKSKTMCKVVSKCNHNEVWAIGFWSKEYAQQKIDTAYFHQYMYEKDKHKILIVIH